jgi:hypothetical protein
MTHRRKSPSRRLIAGIALLAVVLRAFIPVGFMPGAGGQLVLCHDGMHMPNTPHSHYEHCSFGGGPASAPAPSLSATAIVAILEQTRAVRIESRVASIQLVYLPQSRGPPSLA